MSNLTLNGKIAILKSGAISKIVHFALIVSVPVFAIEQFSVITNRFMQQMKNLKIKHSTLRNFYELFGLKVTDLLYKVISLQWSWMRQIFDEIFMSGI